MLFIDTLTKIIPSNRAWWRAIFIVCLLLASCGLDNPQTVEAIPVPTCISPNSYANPYRLSENDVSTANIIYEPYKRGITPINDAQFQAFMALDEYAEHWSAYTDVFLNNSIGARITITYISPTLVHFIVLNHELMKKNLIPDNFQSDLNAKLDKLAKREEMLFLITITAPSYSGQFDASQQLVLDIPMTQMVLTNASDVAVSVTHDDHILEELIPVTRKPVAGFVGFPISIMQNDQCNWIMDPKFNTTITISIPAISLNGQPYGPQSWSIPYAPLIDPGVDGDILALVAAPNFDYSRISPLKVPPPPVWDNSVTSQDNYWETYWQDVGRYIWNYIMLENYP